MVPRKGHELCDWPKPLRPGKKKKKMTHGRALELVISVRVSTVVYILDVLRGQRLLILSWQKWPQSRCCRERCVAEGASIHDIHQEA